MPSRARPSRFGFRAWAGNRCSRAASGADYSESAGQLRQIAVLHVTRQYLPEMGCVLRVSELARARQVKVVEARYPESQRPGAQHQRPGAMLAGGEWTQPRIGVEQ